MTGTSFSTAVSPTPAALQRFVLLASSTTGQGTVRLIQEVLAHKSIYVFGELLDVPSVKELASSDDTTSRGWYTILELFAYGGTVEDYMNRDSTSLPSLSPPQYRKLQLLTLRSLAATSDNGDVPYSVVIGALRLEHDYEVEEAAIEAMDAAILECTLDPLHSTVHVGWVAGRDIPPESMDAVAETLERFLDHSKAVSRNIGNPSETDDEVITKLAKLTKRLEVFKGTMDDYKNFIDEANTSMKGSKDPSPSPQPPPAAGAGSITTSGASPRR
ncbi:COP9 signalosome complex subunit 7a, putative [Perkinsus marinus ATCC 50983]|uniref:COP9 signalosome complex subunit 7a, putative n=1 Tax=Perkinsus marinus (strain ATCC 50983 / TXsc) TaxID=423536 RepID=C5LGQ5_PERM5|nr:COP9 signalosome complex subunit 7a, putative [Perkinsus marinus ATCC 50983]EER04100.1 COP9 signalosome complex subunit 7a, putative [Perkinsus marinus ATCC 50983]|eukprot:XP_002772284.1 COP9 signalosome complex subunit 7a, putative [Perkinsus marinus ATCC 50983]